MRPSIPAAALQQAQAMTATYLSGYERLKNLIEVFNINTLSRLMGMPKPTALATLTRWKAKFNTYGLRSLPPAWALADLRADPLAWHPDADDVEVPDSCQAQVEQASALLARTQAA